MAALDRGENILLSQNLLSALSARRVQQSFTHCYMHPASQGLGMVGMQALGQLASASIATSRTVSSLERDYDKYMNDISGELDGIGK